LESPEIRDRMVPQGADPALFYVEMFVDISKAETSRWEKVVKASAAKVD
jgi:hypothetical protein